MSNDSKIERDGAGQPTDAQGKPVDVVRRDLEDTSGKTKAIDEVITPSDIRTKEQENEELQRKVDEVERKVADGR